MKKIRVLVFGATGTGKTSLCNALTGRMRPTDNGAKGITSKSHLYAPFQFNDCQIELVDTVGLHESRHGTVPAEQAVVELIELLEKARAGFSLLIHVTRASRITEQHDQDYAFFVEKMTQNRIPVILAITGCENEQPMTAWSARNRESFTRFTYRQLVSTCFAVGGPMESHYQPLRELSRDQLCQAIELNALPEPSRIYGQDTGSTFSDVLNRLWNEFVSLAGLPEKYRRQVNESVYMLMKRIGVPQKIADAAIKHVPDLLEELANNSPLPIPGKGKIVRRIAIGLLNRILRKEAA